MDDKRRLDHQSVTVMLGSRVTPHHTKARNKPALSVGRHLGAAPAVAHKNQQSAPRALPKRQVAKAASPPISSATRALSLLLVMVLCAGLIASRLAFWAVIEHGQLAAAAIAARHANLNVQPPLRGQIFDVAGNSLATDISMNLVYAVPKQIKDPSQTARLVAPILGLPEKQLDDIFSVRTSPYALLAPRVPSDVSTKLRNLALPGIGLYPVIRRYYPAKTMASQILGYTDDDNRGWYGLEGYYDSLLAGKAGWQSVLKDTAGNDIHLGGGPTVASHNGAQLYLSIDPEIQGLVEDNLARAIKQHHADSGSIIVMNPNTGYILGMANYPSYDPNQYRTVAAHNAQLFSNAATQGTYEPGSTFKIITMAAGLDSHVITPNSVLDDTGQFVIADTTLHNWNMSGFGIENMTQVLQHSANVGAAWVSQRLGTQRFYDYLKRFRIAQPTGIDLQGESAGILPLPGEKTWTVVNQFTNAFGQGIAITPIQMIRAVATVANGGYLVKPQLVRRMVYDGRIIDHPPVRQGRVISAQTAHTLTTMLVHSAIGGEASLGLVRGYNIAAKTGTSNVAGPNGKYIQGDTVASIVGYAPAYHPRFVVLVKIDHPRDTPWGSMAAAPVLHDLFQELFMHDHIPPSATALNK